MIACCKLAYDKSLAYWRLQKPELQMGEIKTLAEQELMVHNAISHKPTNDMKRGPWIWKGTAKVSCDGPYPMVKLPYRETNPGRRRRAYTLRKCIGCNRSRWTHQGENTFCKKCKPQLGLTKKQNVWVAPSYHEIKKIVSDKKSDGKKRKKGGDRRVKDND